MPVNERQTRCADHKNPKRREEQEKEKKATYLYRLSMVGRAFVSKCKHCLRVCCNQVGNELGTSGSLLNMADISCMWLGPSKDSCPVTMCNMQDPKAQTPEGKS